MMRFALAMAAMAPFALMAAGMSSAPSAHHSMSMFDMNREVSVSGVVREFQWTNPHAYIQIIARDDLGKEVEWSMEMGAPMYLYARGWRPRTLRAGDRVTIRAYPLRSGRPGGVVLDVVDDAGKVVGSNQ